MKRLGFLSLLFVSVASIVGCSSPDDPTPASVAAEPLAIFTGEYDAATPSELAIENGKIYFTTGSYCVEDVRVVDAATTGARALLEKSCSPGLALDATSFYGIVGENFVACPLDGACDAPRILAPTKLLFAPIAVVASNKLVVLLRPTSDGNDPGALFAIDVTTGERTGPLVQFVGDEVPSKLVAFEDHVYYVRRAKGGSGAKDENAIERVTLGADAKAEVLASNLAGIDDFAVDAKGVVFTEGGSYAAGQPLGRVREVPLGGGDVRTLASSQLAGRVAITTSSVVFEQPVDGTVVRIARSDGTEIARSVLPDRLTSNLLATDDDITYGSSRSITGEANQMEGKIVRLPFSAGSRR